MASGGGTSSSGGSDARTLIVLGDSDDDEDVVVNVGSGAVGAASATPASSSPSKRKRGGQRAGTSGSGSSSIGTSSPRVNEVVDLTSGAATSNAFASSSRRNDSDDEIEFVGSSGGTGGASAASAASAQLAQYRAQAAAEFVQFVGSTRPPVAAAAGMNGYGTFGHYGGGGSGSGGSEYDAGSDREWLPPPVADVAPARMRRRSTPSQKKKRRSKRSESPPPPPPMEKGKSLLVPTGFDALDMYYPHLKANDRSAVLHWLLPDGYTKKWVQEWRVAYEKKAGAKSTLWAMVSTLSDEVSGGMPTSKCASSTSAGAGMKKKSKVDDDSDSDSDYDDDLDRKMPAIPSPKGKKGKENKKPATKMLVFSDDDEDEGDGKKVQSVLSTSPIGPLSGEMLDTLRTFFRAHVGRSRHKAKLEGIEAVGDDRGDGLTCSVCCDTFKPEDTVPCSGETDLHFFCKSCFSSYATVTVQSGPIQSIKCPMPGCDSLFATADAKANLSAWDLLMIEHRETSRDRRVCLAAKAVLHCECGAVAIITEEDVGNGRVTCPGEGCGKRYCCKCGNDDHGTEPCPPPAETVQWLDEHSKECPNCKNRIQKNGGCDHMTCAPPGGCGHEFWWTCGCPYRGSHRPGCQRLGEMRL